MTEGPCPQGNRKACSLFWGLLQSFFLFCALATGLLLYMFTKHMYTCIHNHTYSDINPLPMVTHVCDLQSENSDNLKVLCLSKGSYNPLPGAPSFVGFLPPGGLGQSPWSPGKD